MLNEADLTRRRRSIEAHHCEIVYPRRTHAGFRWQTFISTRGFICFVCMIISVNQFASLPNAKNPAMRIRIKTCRPRNLCNYKSFYCFTWRTDNWQIGCGESHTAIMHIRIAISLLLQFAGLKVQWWIESRICQLIAAVPRRCEYCYFQYHENACVTAAAPPLLWLSESLIRTRITRFGIYENVRELRLDKLTWHETLFMHTNPGKEKMASRPDSRNFMPSIVTFAGLAFSETFYLTP